MSRPHMVDPQTPEEVVIREHPFIRAPHRTLLRLSVPVLFSLIAEPITGLVDTGFVARMGSIPLAALGVGTMALSSIFWIFNFLGIGTQTQVAQAMGGGDDRRIRRMTTLALLLSVVFGLMLIAVVWPIAAYVARWMGAAQEVHVLASIYIRARLWGAPAVLITIAGFGVFRGRHNMRIPLLITIGLNLLNALLDPVLIFGYGPLPPMGVAGAAWATVISQWAGALSLVYLIQRYIGPVGGLRWTEAVQLLHIGRDLFIRTAMVTLFLLLATRAATQLGAAAGAAHQAIRQVWMLAALFLDAYAVTGQSLVAYFIGAHQREHARRVARMVCWWSLATGLFLALAMWLGQTVVVALFVPAAALAPFAQAWRMALIAQPLNALAFATDGIHWGTGDFGFLRNVMVVGTAVGAGLLFWSSGLKEFSLASIWTVTAVWITIRAAAGLLRIWPGVGNSPLR